MISPSDIKNIKLHGRDTVQTSLAKIEDKTRTNYFSLFPAEELLKDSIKNSFIINNPMTTVGGDGYWFHKIGETLFLAVYDCMGHGHLASMMTRVYSRAITKIVVEDEVVFPNQILFKLHEEIQRKFDKKDNRQLCTGVDIGMIRYNTQLRELEFAGAKMNLYEVSDGILKIIKADRMQVGEFFDHSHEYKTVIFDLNDKKKKNYYLFSDGLKDLIGGPENKKIGSSNIKNMFEENSQYPMEEQKMRISNYLAEWLGSNSQLDDVLLIGFSI